MKITLVQSLAKMVYAGYNSEDVYLHAAPLFHIGGLSSAVTALMTGATHVFLPRFTAAGAVAAIRAHRVTAFIVVPAMLLDLVNALGGGGSAAAAAATAAAAGRRSEPSADPLLPSVKRILIGGGAMSDDLTAAVTGIFRGAKLTTAYGMTEACSSITWCPVTAPSGLAPPGAGQFVGRPVPGVEVAIRPLSGSDPSYPPAGPLVTPLAGPLVDPLADPLAEGEVLTRGLHVMLGYYADPAATAAAFLPGGWLRTGDLGRMDREGGLWLVGRLKDTVRSGGENVHASEVERVLVSHPGVLAAAVFGLPDERLGERVAACLVLHPRVVWEGSGGVFSTRRSGESSGEVVVSSWGVGSKGMTADGVREFCAEAGLARFKLPRVVFAQWDPLPVNASGKVVKHVLKAAILERIALEEQPPIVSRL